MKQIFNLDSWVIFIFMFLPAIFPDNTFGLVLDIACSALIVAWVYYLGTGLYSKLPGGHTLNLKKFILFLFFPVVYLTITLSWLGGGYSINNHNIDEYGAIAYVIIPLHLFSMYCLFYCIYFLSKSLACVDKQNKNVETSDYIGYFFGFWFFPIGVWFIQPKIKKIFTQ